MKQELVRIKAVDDIEQVGILYNPANKTKKIVVHVHGLNGNFYENRFLDNLALAYTSKNMAFLTFNNRGVNYITELLKGDEFTVIGGCFERFVDSLLDIEGVINWAKEKGYEEIILEGHSYGCNKVLYYYAKKRDIAIKKIVLLAPCDIPTEIKKFLTEEEYIKAKEDATRLVNEGKDKELVDFSVMANGKVSAETFYNDFLPGGENDFIRYSDKTTTKNDILDTIDISTLVIFGDTDECVLTEKIDDVKSYLMDNLKDCKIEIIEGADHSYANKEEELGNIIINNF